MDPTVCNKRLYERYHYAREGRRILKSRQLKTKTSARKQQVRYLPGVEIHSSGSADKYTVKRQVISLHNLHILCRQQGKPAPTDPEQIRFSANDHIDSSNLELDGLGKTISREHYYPFGGTALRATHNQTQASYKTRRYSGKERDASGLLYYGFRYYAPWLMRWLNGDPAGTVDGVNLFRMVQNNPVTLQDKQGLSPTSGSSIASEMTMLDYLLEARKYYTENMQHPNIHLLDTKFMPQLIESEKKRKPGLNLALARTPTNFVCELKRLKENNTERYRGQFIVNMGVGIHYAAFDISINSGEISVIGVEPANMNKNGPAILAVRVLSAVDAEIPSAKVAMIEANIQNSPVDCAIFSLHFSLKMHAEQQAMDDLHQKHLAGALNPHIEFGIITQKYAPLYLPVSFMKHTHSKNRLAEYFDINKNNPGVNIHRDSIMDRQGSYILNRQGRNYSASIEDKRINLIKRMITR
ncbi:MAG: YopJ family acetyltransferase [Rouxiella aceris]|uniref:YopJ family acetyltransferase n=1 Tax=Rouxiella aceris TaxID=2703884 RepID=UPI002851B5BB|nr:YopJ family acetyltransferase [Rouxiella aceris]MDR3434592.1 YopJ family acetyltransferase [Rouxiella aceris]